MINKSTLLLVFSLGFGVTVVGETVKTHDDMKRQSLTTSPPASQPPLDLRAAVKMAIDNNHGIQQARERIEQSRFDTGSMRSALFPNLNIVGTGGEYKAAVLNNQNAPFDGNPYNQYGFDLKLSQPLLVFGSVAAVRQADYGIELSQIDLELAERNLTNQVIQAFYKVLLNQRLLEFLERIQIVVNESLSTAQQRMRTGRGQLLDVLQVKTQMALLKPQIEDAHNQLESAGAQLATFLAEEGKYELQLKGSLKGLHLQDVQPRMDFKNARLPELERVKLSRDQLQQQKDVVEGKHLPSLFLNGDYGAISYTKGDLFSGYSRDWSVILQLTIPLFSGFQSIYERRSIYAQDRQLVSQGRDLENTLALNQVQSLKTLQSTGASLVSAEEAADLARQSLREAQRNYRLATIDFVQFLTVQQSELQADSSLETIKYNNIVAFANYFVATGQSLSTLIDVLEERNR